MVDRYQFGRLLLTLAVVATPGFHVTVDWSVGHVHDPSWPPHAKYHLIVFHLAMVLFALAAVYACWAQSPIRVPAAKFAALTVFAIWVPFYAAALLPGTSPYATPELEHRG